MLVATGKSSVTYPVVVVEVCGIFGVVRYWTPEPEAHTS